MENWSSSEWFRDWLELARHTDEKETEDGEEVPQSRLAWKPQNELAAGVLP
jgi:hypothetical protein